ncbi:MAG: glycosyltransferase family 9 protein [Candidatus Omnitrophica bacterium]|nr:glycosyltransferase family 9 protein [Candidatus Omnitrophota bacterium]
MIRTDRLGETLLTLPAAEALKTAAPGASLTLLVHPTLAPLLEGLPWVDAVIPDPVPNEPRWWARALRLADRLKAGRFDVAVVANPAKAAHVGVWLAGIPLRVGYDRKWGRLLTHRIPDDKSVGGRHEVEYNLRLVDALGIPRPSHLSLQLPVTAQEDQRIAQLFTQRGVSGQDRLVAVHPWTSNPKKQWPVERFRGLIRYVAGLPGVRPVLIGGPEERQGVAEVVDRGAARVIDVVGCLSLKELAACLRRVRALVTNDSGPMHVAAAVGTPVVALFGTGDPGSHPRRWGPWGSGHTVIHKPLEEMTLDEVTQALSQYLA